MTAISRSPARVGRSSLEPHLERVERWALPAILLLATLNFLWHLGSSSYFVDEAYSINHALPSIHRLIHLVNVTETTPYTYFLFLHEWLIRTGSQAEWVTRLPSALAGVALVGAVYWMARALVSRRIALGAAALTAISPLIQAYAQETRVYIFLLLAAVIAVGATVRAVRQPERRVLLLAIGALSSFLAIWLHYTALSIILPLGVWVAIRPELSRRQRAGFLLTCFLGVVSVMPLLLEQYSIFPNGGFIAGSINWTNIISVAGTPFGTRVGDPVNLRTVAGALVVLCSVLTLLISRRRPIPGRQLLVALGIFGLVGLFCLDLLGKHILITRYTVVVAPFLVTVIAFACAELPALVAAALAAATVAVSAAGLIDNHSTSGFYVPARQAISYIAPREELGDFMLSPGPPVTDVPIFYYDARRLRPKLTFFGLTDPRVPQVFPLYRRIWIIDAPASNSRAAAIATVEPLLRAHHFRAVSAATFTTSMTFGVVLAVADRTA